MSAPKLDRAALEAATDAELLLLVIGGIGPYQSYGSVRRNWKGPKRAPWFVWELTFKQAEDRDGECSYFKLPHDSRGIPSLPPNVRTKLLDAVCGPETPAPLPQPPAAQKEGT